MREWLRVTVNFFLEFTCDDYDLPRTPLLTEKNKDGKKI